MRNWCLMLCVLALTMVGCGDSDDPGDTDSGVRNDASMPVDSSTPPVDARVGVDAGDDDDDAGMVMTDAGTDGGDVEGVSFREDVWPILMRNCVGCHVGGSRGTLALGMNAESAYAALVDVPHGRGDGCDVPARVTTGDADMSLLVLKLEGSQPAGCGVRMPQGDPDGLPPADIETIRMWIAEGARNN